MIHTLPFSSFSVSQTFEPRPKPEMLDIESKDGNHDLLSDLPRLGFAVIGTRTPQRRSFELLEKTFAELKNSGLIIISGLARGIDSRAHELAIEHGLKTIAILGNGIDMDYPIENRPLRKKIIDHGGLVISQFERGHQPIRRNFVNRNQLIAGFSSAIWVVEAAAISGTLNTATHAAKFNREIYATPCFPGDPFFQGNEKLLSEKDPDRYPIAKALFSAEGLIPTWPELARLHDRQHSFGFGPGFKPKSDLQKWVTEIKSQYGECQIQALMNVAYSNGLTLGTFYLRYEKEIEMGLICEDALGRVSLNVS